MAANEILGEASGIASDEALALYRLMFEIRSFEKGRTTCSRRTS